MNQNEKISNAIKKRLSYELPVITTWPQVTTLYI